MTSIVFLTIAVVSLVETLNSALRGRHSGPAADAASAAAAAVLNKCPYVYMSDEAY